MVLHRVLAARCSYRALPLLLGSKPVKLLLPGWRNAAVTVLHASATVLTDQPSVGRKAFLRRCVHTGAEAELAATAAGPGAAPTGCARAASGVARSARMTAGRSIAETLRKLRHDNATSSAVVQAEPHGKVTQDTARHRPRRAAGAPECGCGVPPSVTVMSCTRQFGGHRPREAAVRTRLVDGAALAASDHRPLAENTSYGSRLSPVHAHGFAMRFAEAVQSVLHGGGLGQDPPVDCGVVDRKPPLEEYLLNVTVAERVAQVSGDGLHDQRGLDTPAPRAAFGLCLQLEVGVFRIMARLREEQQDRRLWLSSREPQRIRDCDRSDETALCEALVAAEPKLDTIGLRTR